MNMKNLKPKSAEDYLTALITICLIAIFCYQISVYLEAKKNKVTLTPADKILYHNGVAVKDQPHL